MVLEVVERWKYILVVFVKVLHFQPFAKKICIRLLLSGVLSPHTIHDILTQLASAEPTTVYVHPLSAQESRVLNQ